MFYAAALYHIYNKSGSLGVSYKIWYRKPPEFPVVFIWRFFKRIITRLTPESLVMI